MNTTQLLVRCSLAFALCAGVVACDQAKAAGGPDKVAECKDYLEVLDACDAKQKAPAAGVEQKVFRKTWMNEITHKSVSELAQECSEKAAEKRKSCGLEKP